MNSLRLLMCTITVLIAAQSTGWLYFLYQLEPEQVSVSMSTEADLLNAIDYGNSTSTELLRTQHQVSDLIRKKETQLTFRRELYTEQLAMFDGISDRVFKTSIDVDQLYDSRIVSLLGDPLYVYRNGQYELLIFQLKELGYRGYMAKIRLYNPHALQVALAEDHPQGLEQTSEIASRKGAIFAVNGGGFGRFQSLEGEYATTIGATIMNGEIVREFYKDPEQLFLAGIDQEGHLKGAHIQSQQDVEQLNLIQGISFIPILLDNGDPLPIPGAWAHARQPRTILGSYANGDLLFLVIDGRQRGWSNGVTLEDLQEKLIHLGIQDAYNLDGGGSSTFYFLGEVMNRPADGFERSVANCFILLP